MLYILYGERVVDADEELIQRRAYGYRNFQNYRLRVLIECGHIVI